MPKVWLNQILEVWVSVALGLGLVDARELEQPGG
jgi:hypothetical protein